MAYPDHYLLQFGGKLSTASDEIWTCGIRLKLQNALPTNFNPAGGYMEDTAAPALASWFADADSRISGNATLTFLKCNRIDSSGHYADQGETDEYYYPTPVGGGAGGAIHPFQCSVVLSWETDAASRGPASKGRIYSPMPVVVITSNGLFDIAQAQTMAESGARLLNSLDDSVDTGQIRPHIVSGVGSGTAHEINTCRVDNVVDTQRRRRNALVGQSYVKHFSY